MPDFNPNSSDAVFSRILQRLEEQDSVASKTRVEFLQVLGDIKEQTTKTNGRVGKLERWQTEVKAKVAVVAMAASGVVSFLAWLIDHMGK